MRTLRSCVEIVAIPAEPGQLSAQALSDVSGLNVTHSARPVRNAFYFARGKGCSCSLLRDDANPASPTWALDRRVLDGLANAVTLLAERANGLTFQALGVGDGPTSREQVTLGDLLRDIRSNAIKNKFVYVIGKAGEPSPI